MEVLKMKKLFKITALIMALAMALCCFTACGNNAQNDADAEGETAYAGTYELNDDFHGFCNAYHGKNICRPYLRGY